MSIAIVGVGETDYAWKDPRPPVALAVDAVQRALADAGLTGADVDGVVTESYTLASKAPADLVAARIGVRGWTVIPHGAGSGGGGGGSGAASISNRNSSTSTSPMNRTGVAHSTPPCSM